MRHNKSARDLEKEASKTYNIEVLWQRSRDLGMVSKANNQVGLEQLKNCSQITVYLQFLLYLMFLSDVFFLSNNKFMTINRLRY